MQTVWFNWKEGSKIFWSVFKNYIDKIFISKRRYDSFSTNAMRLQVSRNFNDFFTELNVTVWASQKFCFSKTKNSRFDVKVYNYRRSNQSFVQQPMCIDCKHFSVAFCKRFKRDEDKTQVWIVDLVREINVNPRVPLKKHFGIGPFHVHCFVRCLILHNVPRSYHI